MRKPASTTAVMVFSLNAEEEARRKPLFKNNKDSRKLYQSLLDQTATTIQELNADIIWIDGRNQKGNDFASRFCHAFTQTYAMGYEQVIAVGNDSPGLTRGHLKTAIAQLKSNAVVAGPARDGGVYLLGMQCSYFKASAFLALPWQQDHLYASILDDARSKNLEVFSLNSLQDIDELEDVFAFAKEKPGSFISQVFWLIIARKQQVSILIENNTSTENLASFHSLRAPPASFA